MPGQYRTEKDVRNSTASTAGLHCYHMSSSMGLKKETAHLMTLPSSLSLLDKSDFPLDAPKSGITQLDFQDSKFLEAPISSTFVLGTLFS
jgi:hypothetical protein